MNRATTAREVLIVEALGDVARLLDRIDTMTPAMNSTLRALVKANADLGDRVNAFESHMAALTENAKQKTVEHVVRRTNEVFQQSFEVQSKLMTDSARKILNEELGSTLTWFNETLKRLVERIEKPAWELWWIYVATIVATAGTTFAVTAFVYSSEDRTLAARSSVPPAVASRPSPAPSSGRLVRRSERATSGASASR